MPSFDIVSEVNLQEVDNAVNQARKEISTRFDFKDRRIEIEWDRKVIQLSCEDEFLLKSVVEVLTGKLAKRNVSLKNIDFGKAEVAPTGGARQTVKLVQGIETPKAKEIIQSIKDAKLKVQTQIQEQKIRVTGKSRDELQSSIALVRGKDFGLSLSFNNFRD
ncbi:MAG: YajQ family cyclic di-GMP-binding protein [Verrucomicrobiae bacterium]|nr:YajQ family cyclic di-GMP-binding protein [Verrucomicrobiae bacterium]